MKKYVVLAAVIVIAAATVVVMTQNFSRLRGALSGSNEVPYVSTQGTGDFDARVSEDGAAIEYTLNYSNMQGTVSQAHIHIAQKNVNGGISVWLCGNPTAGPPPINPPTGTPLCESPSDTFTGTITAANVVGPAGQGVASGEFDELLEAIRSGNAYVNVHSSLAPGGEIRAQIGTHNSDHSH